MEDIRVRDAKSKEFASIGSLMVRVYSQLDGFPKEEDQPKYYEMLRNIGDFTKKPKAKLIVAVDSREDILGGVIYFGDMAYYGSGGTATKELNACGFRLLAVDPSARGRGIGKLLTLACIELAKKQGFQQQIIHTTHAMQVAWKMYESLGFKRSEDLDFMQEDLPVYGFRLWLSQ